ncbi:putative B-box zinc finger family protein [Monocercomonoides exilis]|uniref:putative B-box zinc finger family protein n=1 Tax=Monocercomonoides exilis TaxID=2049356 RepID=UPI00355A78D3|nr:putative B-box zinc finger family protein [Monocercomonoides exilis]|eukprot:MONOS_1575.1-p1 / transcript=MONOS_1575.1 / gene=MONOS_1575 / organism=Monocercomonoides_exilis_PA203 / gene_product=B-box zinc finger family protein / transcript_product=B-box zinc finger family protein / location=Mono_scaffold00028:88545-90037(+) / protein_length=444 / sequence_SO=supercontig / SO=protein_coding / is_pseudo=false
MRESTMLLETGLKDTRQSSSRAAPTSSSYLSTPMQTGPFQQPQTASSIHSTSAYNQPFLSSTNPIPLSSTAPSSSSSTVMCDSCPPESPNPAVYFCRQCRGNFCENCDAQFHPSHNALMSRHVRLPIDSSRSALFCSEHPEEELSYYCLSCEGTCICSECAIRGAHKGHDVQTIRKSYGEVRKRMNEIVSALAMRQEAVKKILMQIEAHEQEIADNTRSIKESMALSFNELREKIRRKELEFMATADKFQEEQIAELSSFISYAQTKQNEITGAISQMKGASESSDEIGLLNFYGTHKQVATDLLKDTPIDVRLPEVASRRCYLDMESANKQLEGLSALHLAVASVQATYTQGIEGAPGMLPGAETGAPMSMSLGDGESGTERGAMRATPSSARQMGQSAQSGMDSYYGAPGMENSGMEGRERMSGRSSRRDRDVEGTGRKKRL